MELKNKEKLIWEISSKIQLPDPPDKNEVWERISQSMNILDDQLDRAQYSSASSSANWRLKEHLEFNLKGLLSFSFALILILPILYNTYLIDTVVTRIGENKTLQLADGSKVILNSESKISFNRDYNVEHRYLKLEGEAYFDITESNMPFIIETDHGKITVLGTIFNVYSRENGFEVGVNEGKIKVSNHDHTMQLEEGQFINVSSSFDNKDISKISYSDYPDWINQKFYCDRTSLADLCSEVERTFNIKIQFSKPSLKSITVSGLIEAVDLKTVLHTISLLTQHEFKLEGDTCTII